MNKELLDILNELSKKDTTDLAMSCMELQADVLVKENEKEELQEKIKELEEEIKIKNRTICHQSIIIMNANEYLENYSNGEFDFDKLANILKGEE